MIFQVENGCFGYHRETILQDVTFEINSGEVLAILGSNGVGKTTLLRCMMGLLNWNSGSTILDGKNLNTYSSKKVWTRISYVPQARGVTFAYSAFDMVLLGRSAHLGIIRQPDKRDYNIAAEAMKEIGILSLKDKLCTQMSGGELQMVLIARALAAQPELLVLDEPESNLDFKNQLIILDTIRYLAEERNISSILNTHYPSHALQISDKALILNRGEKNRYGPTEEIICEEYMREAFGVNVSVHQFNVNGKHYRTVVPLSIVK